MFKPPDYCKNRSFKLSTSTLTADDEYAKSITFVHETKTSMSLTLSINLPLQDPVLIITVMILVIFLSPLLLERIKIPAIAGLLIFGMMIGPNGFNIIPQNLEFSLFSTTGLLYLMFLAGLEIDLIDFIKNKGKSIVLGLMSFAFPFVLGFLISHYMLSLDVLPSLLIGAMLSSHTLIAYPIASKMGIISTTIVTIIIGGTIIADVVALISLQIISDYAADLFNPEGIIRMLLNFTVFGLILFVVIPWISKMFFKYFMGDLIIQYLFILTLLFISATTAELLHIEPIIGAFFCGLVLNRNIINGSPLYQRIEFIGNSLFIPIFLISVGLLVNPGFYFENPSTILPLAILIVVAIAGKYIAAFLMGLFFRLKKHETNLIVGLTTARAASAIAIVLVGYKLGLFNEAIINHTVVLILITSILSTYITQNNAKKVADDALSNMDERDEPEVIMVPVSNPANVPTLLRFASYLKTSSTNKAIYGLSVLANVPTVQDQINKNKLIFHKTVEDLKSDVPFKLITRIDSTVTNGISKAMKELSANIMILGWHEKTTPFEVLFGNILNNLINSTNKMVWVVKTPGTQLNNSGIIHLFLPPDANKEIGFKKLTKKAAHLSRILKNKIIVHSNESMANDMEALFKTEIKGYYQGNVAHCFDHTEISNLNPSDSDLFLIVQSRRRGNSYNKSYNKFVMTLIEKHTDLNIIFVYPDQL